MSYPLLNSLHTTISGAHAANTITCVPTGIITKTNVQEALTEIGGKTYAGSATADGAATSALACIGNAASATKWAVARSVALSGVVTGSATIDGSADATVNTSIADGALTIAKISGLQNSLNDKVPVSTTFLGIVGNVGIGTLSSPEDWANIPVGCSRLYQGTTATGFPNTWTWYITKIANRDIAGGYCVMAVTYDDAVTYMGVSQTSSSFPTWRQIG